MVAAFLFRTSEVFSLSPSLGFLCCQMILDSDCTCLGVSAELFSQHIVHMSSLVMLGASLDILVLDTALNL